MRRVDAFVISRPSVQVRAPAQEQLKHQNPEVRPSDFASNDGPSRTPRLVKVNPLAQTDRLTARQQSSADVLVLAHLDVTQLEPPP